MLNQCTLTGNLGGDPEVFYSSEGNPVASFSLAFHSSKKKTGWILTFVQWTEIFGSEQLTGALLTDSPTGVISKRRIGKIFDRPAKDLL